LELIRTIFGEVDAHLFRGTQPPVCLARTLLDRVSKRVKSLGYFAIECLGSHAAQLDDLVLNKRQMFDVTDHEGSL
jgi:hypothetical protein